MNYSYVVSTVDEPLLSEAVNEKLYAFIASNWKEEYGSPVDFGGGVIDVTCGQLLDSCGSKAQTLKSMFPGMTLADAKSVIAKCLDAVES